MHIIKGIFEKQLIKYELSFNRLDDDIILIIRNDIDEYILYYDMCECNNFIISIYSIYNAALSLNLVDLDMAWALNIIYDFYVVNNFAGEHCSTCISIKNEIYSYIKNKNNTSILSVDIIDLSFLTNSNLYFSINNTLKTICTKKLMRDKKRYIFELLAKEGISMTNAYTLYKNIDYE